MAIKGKIQHDSLRYQFLTEKENVMYTDKCVCYAQTMYNYKEKAGANAKWYDVYWADTISNHFNNTKTTHKFLEAIALSGLFSNCNIEILKDTQCNKEFLKSLSKEDVSNWWIRLRHDIDNTTAQEMFLIGLVIRTISSRPNIILNFLRLYKLYKEKYKVEHIFMIAHVLSWGDRYERETQGHQMLSSCFCYLSGKTFKDFLELAKEYPTIRNNKDYNYTIKEGIEGYFTVQERLRLNSYSYRWRTGGTKFKRGAIKSFFDGDLFNKLYDKDVSLVCRNSYN